MLYINELSFIKYFRTHLNICIFFIDDCNIDILQKKIDNDYDGNFDKSTCCERKMIFIINLLEKTGQENFKYLNPGRKTLSFTNAKLFGNEYRKIKCMCDKKTGCKCSMYDFRNIICSSFAIDNL